MPNHLPSFQRYQQAFTAYIRDPHQHALPNGVQTKGLAVYQEVVFNNLFESVSACFPVAQKVLGKRAWLALVRGFLREHSASSPIFREIPEEFLRYVSHCQLANQTKLPPYLTSLCHYEWIELLVASMIDADDTDIELNSTNEITLTSDLLNHQAIFSPTIQLLDYEYAVQKISPRYKPKDKVSTQLLVYRNAEYDVKFIALNFATYQLIKLLQQESMSCEQALTMLASDLNQSAERVIQFGLEVLNDLQRQGVITGFSRLT